MGTSVRVGLAEDNTPDRPAGTRGTGRERVRTCLDRALAPALPRAGRANPGAALESKKIDAAQLEARIAAVGRTEFEEARAVLSKDGLLPPPVSDQAAYAVFAAVFLELTYFDPAARSIVFPAIECVDSVESILAGDLDGKLLLATSRPAGAPTRSFPRRRRPRRQ